MASTLSPEDQLLELDPVPYIYRFAFGEFLRVILVGAIVGFITPLISSPISKYIIQPFFCRTSSNILGACSEGSSVAFGVALTIISITALLILASLRTYQPLLNVIAPLAALWALTQNLPNLATHKIQFYIFSTILFALAYGLFYLLLRFRNLIISLVLTIVVIVVVQWQF